MANKMFLRAVKKGVADRNKYDEQVKIESQKTLLEREQRKQKYEEELSAIRADAKEAYNILLKVSKVVKIESRIVYQDKVEDLSLEEYDQKLIKEITNHADPQMLTPLMNTSLSSERSSATYKLTCVPLTLHFGQHTIYVVVTKGRDSSLFITTLEEEQGEAWYYFVNVAQFINKLRKHLENLAFYSPHYFS